MVIERSDSGGIVVLRLAHGPVSAMDLELVRAITATFHTLADERPDAVVLTGSGRAFSAGVDLRRFVDGGADYVREFFPALSDAFQAVFEFPRPVVAAVNGHAIAGGCVLACCCDVRVMAESNARIGVPELKVGVAFPRVPLEILRCAVGEVQARRLVLGADTYPPAEGFARGLVDEIVPADELVDRAVDLATQLAATGPPATFEYTKAQLHRETLERIARYRVDEDPQVEQAWSEQAGPGGWVEKYLASVTGRG